MRRLSLDYDLLDFGDGLRWERFGPLTACRPCPAALGSPRQGLDPAAADAYFEKPNDSAGKWRLSPRARELTAAGEWVIGLGRVRLLLQPTPQGQVGLFPDHADTWSRVSAFVAELLRQRSRCGSEVAGEPPRILNLFAYTGAGTLLWAADGARVTHVDASRPAVHWGRRNAAISALAEAPIRWLVEDARKYVARERRRNARYDVVVLDPPSYGHGPKGSEWVCERDVTGLLADILPLVPYSPAMIALSCHTPALAVGRLRDCFFAASEQSRAGSAAAWRVTTRDTALADSAGRRLTLGTCLWARR